MHLVMEEWMAAYISSVEEAFGGRVRFIGLQGSRGRGEAGPASDIDVVLVLDRLELEDLEAYGREIARLPFRELVCGFLCGQEELEGWEGSDLFQLYHDTMPLVGSLDELIPPPGRADARRAVLLGACNLYHGCVHNLVHDKSMEILWDLYKSLYFILRTKYYCETGAYLKKKSELLPRLPEQERELLEKAPGAGEPAGPGPGLQALSGGLLRWSRQVIREYSNENQQERKPNVLPSRKS